MISPAHALAAEAGCCKLLLDGVSDCCWMTGLRSQYFVCRITRSASVCLGGFCYPQCVHSARKLPVYSAVWRSLSGKKQDIRRLEDN